MLCGLRAPLHPSHACQRPWHLSMPGKVGSVQGRPGPQALSAQADNRRRELFDRASEEHALTSHVKEAPTRILCILGPRNSGKSALVGSCVTEGPLEGRAVLYDCRSLITSSPQEFASAALRVPFPSLPDSPDTIRERVIAAAQREYARRGSRPEDVFEFVVPMFLKGVPKFAPPGVVSGALEDFARSIFRDKPIPSISSYQTPPGPDMGTFLQSLSDFADVWNKLGFTEKKGYPVIVFDEANSLYSWQDKFSDSLKDLKNQLVRLTKQSKLCHVILVSSDFGFLRFLEAPPAGLTNEWFDVLFVNGFEEQAAKEFMDRQLKARNQRGIDAMGDDTWASTYEVCGGNPQSLQYCAQYVTPEGGLEEGLKAIEREVAAQVYSIIGPQNSPTPLRLPYAKLVTTMLASPPWYSISFDYAVGSVLRDAFLQLPEHADRAEVVRQLTAANLLMTRPRSRYGEVARPDLFGGSGLAVFPTGRAMLHIMKILESELRQSLKTAEQQWKEEQQRQLEREEEEKQLRQLQMEREQVEREVQTLEKDLQLTGWWEFPLRAKLKGAIRDRLEAFRRLGTKEEGGAAGSRND